MKTTVSLLLALLFSCAVASGQEKVIQDRKAYKTINGTVLNADIFYTEASEQDYLKPAIVFYHGGGWAYGTPDEFHEACRRYARKGFVTFSIQYRLCIKEDRKVPHPEITPVECVKDARSAMRWVRENAGSFHIDPDKIIAAGQSAGGQLALSTAMFDDINEASDNTDISPVPAALLLFSSNVNTMEAWCDMLLGDRRKEIWSISPYHNLRSGLPPAIAFHGTADCMVPIYIINLFKEETLRLGNYYELVTYEGREHYLGKGNDKYATYFNEETLDRTDEFLEKFGFMDP